MHYGFGVAAGTTEQAERVRGESVTNNELRPKSQKAHLEWTPSRIVQF
jgi:hypothetical protein